MAHLGVVLQTLMDKQNLSARELARRIGVPQKTLNEWLGSNGRMPRDLSALKKLAEYFQVSTHFLLFGEEDSRSSLASILEKSEIHTGLYEITIRKVVQK